MNKKRLIIIVILVLTILSLGSTNNEDINWGVYVPKENNIDLIWSGDKLLTTMMGQDRSIILTENNPTKKIIIPEFQKEEFANAWFYFRDNYFYLFTRVIKDGKYKVKKIFIGTIDTGKVSIYDVENLNISVALNRVKKVKEKIIIPFKGLKLPEENEFKYRDGVLVLSPEQEIKVIEIYNREKNKPSALIEDYYVDEEGFLITGEIQRKDTAQVNLVLIKVDYQGALLFSKEYFLPYKTENYSYPNLSPSRININENYIFILGNLHFSFLENNSYSLFQSPYLLVLDKKEK